MPSNLQIIADKLDISTATVSRALNGKPGVSDHLRRRVLDIAYELNINPSPVAQNMSSDNHLAIGFVIRQLLTPMVDDAFYDRIMKSAGMELGKFGYHLVPISIDPSSPRLPINLDKNRLDGLLLVGPELPQHTFDEIMAIGLPVVLTANRNPYDHIDSVTSANEAGGFLATKHLVDHGHKNIACISGPEDWSPVGDRIEGYRKAAKKFGFSPIVVHRPGYLIVDNGYSAMQEIMEKYPEVDAVFAANDPMAVGALRAIRDAGRHVPSDIAVIGFDNIVWADTTDPPLTTVNIHKEEIGLFAARRLLEIIQKGPQVPVDIQVKNELVIRCSCGCLSATEK
jgi:LacI family transcriptional regulator